MSDFTKYTDYKTVLTVNALTWAKGKVLLLKRSGDKKVEPGEDFYSALLMEEED